MVIYLFIFPVLQNNATSIRLLREQPTTPELPVCAEEEHRRHTAVHVFTEVIMDAFMNLF